MYRTRRHRSAARFLAVTTLAVTAALAVGTLAPGAGAQAPAEHASCSTPSSSGVRCYSAWKPAPDRSFSQPSTSVAPAPARGITPADLRATYRIPGTGGAEQTIGIVDAFDHPNVEADLAVYRSTWGLSGCTTANGCFRKVDQRGGTAYPPTDAGWGVEIALDVQAVSAVCPGCKILLVEADDPSLPALGAAVDTAIRLGATVVSNSYGTDEFGGMIDVAAQHYDHPGVPILAASGDRGFRIASFPAVLDTIWAVGGTFLKPAATGGWEEEAWSYAGSACSAWIAKPAEQEDLNCSMRTVADISAMADAAEGFAVYDSFGLGPDAGWITASGTSLSAPLIAGMIGLAGHPAQVADPAYLYQHRAGLQDVVGGLNGFCGADYLCTGVPGYDAPTGLGSPRGLSSL
jgi:subtilase family serine protease